MAHGEVAAGVDGEHPPARTQSTQSGESFQRDKASGRAKNHFAQQQKYMMQSQVGGWTTNIQPKSSP